MTKTKITKEIEQALIQHYCSGQFNENCPEIPGF